jgi:hypothetical protein
MPKLIAVSALIFAANALAASDERECTNGIYAAIEHDLHLKDFGGRAQDEGFIVSQACKVWPYKPKLTLAALAYDDGIEYEKELVVAVIDEKKKRVVSSAQWKVQEGGTTEIGKYSLGFDTARYQLAEGVRAFGLRFRSSARGANCPDAYHEDQLILLVPKKKSLRLALSLYRHQVKSIQGCLHIPVSDVAWDARLAIGVENTRTNGFHDLRIMANLSDEKDHVEHMIFRYNGRRYEPVGKVPWWLLFWNSPPGY